MAQNNPRIFTPFVGTTGDHHRDRAEMLITASDIQRFDSLPRQQAHDVISVFDAYSQEHYYVRRATCGGGCFCAAEIVDSGDPSAAKPVDHQTFFGEEAQIQK